MSLEKLTNPERRDFHEVLIAVIELIAKEEKGDAMQVFREWRAAELAELQLEEGSREGRSELLRMSEDIISNPSGAISYYLRCASIHSLIRNSWQEQNAIDCAKVISARYGLEDYFSQESHSIRVALNELSTPGESAGP